jgi:imidazolonepropionase-like amidohydrolase
VADEAAELVAAGLTTVEALSAGTWAAREWLGRPGIEEGASADLVLYQADPRDDISVLKAPMAVVLRGQTV